MKYTKVDRVEGTKALNEGFVMIFGEKYRNLFETKGEELIELGLKNGKDWVRSLVLKNSRISTKFEMFNEGIGNIKPEDIINLENQMKIYFTQDEIDFLKKEYPSDIKDDSYHFMDGVDEYTTIFCDNVLESDVNVITPTPFDYFKKFRISNKYNLTLHGEGGLGLDNYSKQDLKYYKEENELCYMVESISLKYHYFGMLLARYNKTESWIKKICSNLSEDTNYWLKSELSNIIYRLIQNNDDADEVILYIQNKLDIKDGFITHKQLTDRISKIDISTLPKNLFE